MTRFCGTITIPPQFLRNLRQTQQTGSDLELGFVALGEAPANAPEPIRWKSIDSGYGLFVSMVGRTVRFE